MKKSHLYTCVGAAVLLFLCSAPLAAQEIVFNGDIETREIVYGWTLTGGNQNTLKAYYPVILDDPSWCIRRMPGTPNNNGSIEQEVHLVGGVTYEFSAAIAASENG
jgi:hypothetical protein